MEELSSLLIEWGSCSAGGHVNPTSPGYFKFIEQVRWIPVGFRSCRLVGTRSGLVELRAS